MQLRWLGTLWARRQQHVASAEASAECPWSCSSVPFQTSWFGLRKEGTSAPFHDFRALETRWFSQCRRGTRLAAQGLCHIYTGYRRAARRTDWDIIEEMVKLHFHSSCIRCVEIWDDTTATYSACRYNNTNRLLLESPVAT